jgi:hypothetical protein
LWTLGEQLSKASAHSLTIFFSSAREVIHGEKQFQSAVAGLADKLGTSAATFDNCVGFEDFEKVPNGSGSDVSSARGARARCR